MKANQTILPAALLTLALASLASLPVRGATILKLDDTNALTDPLSWTNGVANVVPGSADIAQWNGTYASTNAWNLGASTNWAGIQVLSPSRAFTINNDGNTLTLGTSGIDLSLASQNVTFNSPLVLGVAQTWVVTNNRTLAISGTVTNTGALLSITNNGSGANGGTVQIGNTGTAGSLSGNVTLVGGATLAIARSDTATPIGGVISGNCTNSLVRNNSTLATNTTTLNFADGVNIFGGVINYSPGTLVLNASAKCTNYFLNPNGLSSTGPLHNANHNTNFMVINGGTWIVTNGLNNNGSGSSGTTWSGTNYLTNCTVIVGDARFIHGVTYIQNGATFAQTNASGSRISFDSQDATGVSEGFYVLPGGTLNCWANNYGFQLGSSTAGGYANSTTFVQQSGGLVQMGVMGGGGSKNLLLGEGTSSATTYYALSGGKLVVAGSIVTNSPGNASANSFNWSGGTVVAATINMSGISSGTLTNAGGTLAPGDIGTPGKTIITGNYVQSSGSLAIDLGGTTQANAFTNAANNYDFVSVSGSAALGGTLNVNLINSFTPTANNAFTVMTASGGYLAGPANFANNYNGYLPVSLSPLKYMQAIVVGNNLILTNYGVTPPVLTASFTPTNAIGVAPFLVNFTDTSVGAITNRHWNFGDGGTLDTTATAVSYTYNTVGTYTNILTVADVAGNKSYATGVVHAVNASVSLTWKGDGVANVWNTTTANWLNGAIAATYADPDNVTFDDTGSATPNLALNFGAQPGSVLFNNSAKNYTIGGSGGIDGNASVTISGTGVVTLLTANTCTGPVAVNSGTLQLGNGATTGSIDNASAITDNGALIFNQPDNHAISAVITGSGSLTKAGNGTLTLTPDNSATFTGPVAITGGTLAAASDNSLGASSDPVTLTNATLQYNTSSSFTLNRPLDLEGTNDGLNVNGTVILPNSPSGAAAVTLGGNGTLQIDQGGTSVTLPTNLVLNGGSITYQRSDNYAQPGVVSGSSATSTLNNAGTASGNTNTLTFANGNNLFGSVLNTSSGELDLDASPNSTNILGGASGLSYSGNATLAVNGGTFTVTNANIVGSSAGTSTGTLIINSGMVNSSFVNGNNGGSRHFKGNLAINGGTFHVTTDRLSMDDSSGSQTLTLSAGNLMADNSSGGGSFGFRFGNDGGSPGQAGYTFTGVQTGGALLCSNSPIIMGGVTTNKTTSYTLSGGTASVIGGGAGLILCSDTNGTGSTSFTLTNAAKLTVLGTINGGTVTNTAVQVFSFLGGTLVAEAVDTTYLRDSATDPVGTFVNGGGTFLPGDVGYAGKLTVTGNYVCSNTASLGIELGGTSAASAGQETVNTNRYDNVLVNGAAALAGNLNLTLINGFEPVVAQNRTFTILAATNGVSGTFANLSGGRVHLVGDAARSFAVTVTSSNVVLGGYQTPSSQAWFTQSTNAGTAPLTVTFTNLSNGAGLTNLWSFGDGGTSVSTAATVSHTYTGAGTNTVSLAVGSTLGVNTYTVSNAVAVTGASALSPTSLTNSFNGTSLVLSWPNGQGWVLEAQTNSLTTGLGANWVPVAGATSPFTNTPNPANGTVFYRLSQ